MKGRWELSDSSEAEAELIPEKNEINKDKENKKSFEVLKKMYPPPSSGEDCDDSISEKDSENENNIKLEENMNSSSIKNKNVMEEIFKIKKLNKKKSIPKKDLSSSSESESENKQNNVKIEKKLSSKKNQKLSYSKAEDGNEQKKNQKNKNTEEEIGVKKKNKEKLLNKMSIPNKRLSFSSEAEDGNEQIMIKLEKNSPSKLNQKNKKTEQEIDAKKKNKEKLLNKMSTANKKSSSSFSLSDSENENETIKNPKQEILNKDIEVYSPNEKVVNENPPEKTKKTKKSKSNPKETNEKNDSEEDEFTNFEKNLDISYLNSSFFYEEMNFDEEEIFIFKCPYNVNLDNLIDKKFQMKSNNKLELNDQRKMNINVRKIDSSGFTLLLPSKKSKSYEPTVLYPKGMITLEREIPNKEITIDLTPKEMVPFPKDIKIRHPLLGRDWDKETTGMEHKQKIKKKKDKKNKDAFDESESTNSSKKRPRSSSLDNDMFKTPKTEKDPLTSSSPPKKRKKSFVI